MITLYSRRFFGRSKLTLSIFLCAEGTAKFLWKKRIDFPFLSFNTDNSIARENKGFMDEAGKHRLKAESDKITACIFSRRNFSANPSGGFYPCVKYTKRFYRSNNKCQSSKRQCQRKGGMKCLKIGGMLSISRHFTCTHA